MNELFLKLKIINALAGIVLKGKSVGDFILGKPVKIFERALAKLCGAEYAFGVASGTDALILSLKALGIGPGDEVIVPAVSFYSSAGAVSWVNAKPVFIDVSPKDHNIDVSKIERAVNSKTKAIIAVHLNGRMADMEQILKIAKRHSLFVIEDAAQAIGARYKNKPPGYYGDFACLSFNPSKILSGYGDGGAVVTKSTAYAEKISMMRMYGTTFENISVRHPILGIASRLNPFQAAVLSIKIENLDNEIERRRRNYFLYEKFLDNTGDLILPEISNAKDYFINGYRFVVLTKKRDQLIKFLKEHKIYARNHYGTPLPFLGAFSYLGHKKGDFPAAEKIADESLVLPTDSQLDEKEIERVSALIKQFFE